MLFFSLTNALMSDFSEKSSSLLKANKYLSNEKKPIVSRPNIDHLIKRIIIEKRKEKKKKSFCWMCDCFDGIFSFQVRKADGGSLGVEVTHVQQNRALLVKEVLPGGALEAWNKLCSDSCAAPRDAVHYCPGGTKRRNL